MLEYKSNVRVLTFAQGDEKPYVEALRESISEISAELDRINVTWQLEPSGPDREALDRDCATLINRRAKLHYLLLALTDGIG